MRPSARIGFSTLKVVVVGLQGDGRVMVRDRLGNHYHPADIRSWGELPPKNGQHWLMERTDGGMWRLTKMLDPPVKEVPTVEGTVPEVMGSLLDGLVTLGHINDTTERVKPVISGPRASVTPQMLLDALTELGLVDDQTT